MFKVIGLVALGFMIKFVTSDMVLVVVSNRYRIHCGETIAVHRKSTEI